MTNEKIDMNELTTPDYFFQELHKKHNFTIDVCATFDNRKCERYYSKEDNCLTKSWKDEIVWLQPPYNNSVWQKFLEYGMDQVLNNGCKKVVALIPAKTGVKAFHSCIWDRENNNFYPWVKVDFLQGRLKFGGFSGAGRFDSMVVIFEKPKELF